MNSKDQFYKTKRVIVIGFLIGLILLTSSASGATEIKECTTIFIPGDYYFSKDIISYENYKSCIIIRVSEVTLDGKGYSVSRNTLPNFPGKTGVEVYDSSGSTLTNVVVKNVVVLEGYENGIQIGRAHV